MKLTGHRPTAAVWSAMLASAVVSAQFIAGKATRDALYLAHLDVTTLPAMIVATSTASIVLVIGSSKVLRRLTAATFVPLAFVVSAVLLLFEWALVPAAPRVAATLVYLHISGFGPILGSSLWLILGERFDPRTAKRHFGQIAGAGTLGGLAGGLLAGRSSGALDVAGMLPILAVLNIGGAWLVRRLSVLDERAPHYRSMEIAPELSSETPQSGLQVLARTPYLRDLAALVVIGSTAAALLDYVFKARVQASYDGDSLLAFFGVYYAAIAFITFVVQAVSTGTILEKFGLSISAGTPSMAAVAGGTAALAFPGLGTVVAARGAESIFRGSLFRSGYEVFFTPIPAVERRATKSVIDVGFDRLGDAVGAGLVRTAIWVAPAGQWSIMLAGAVGCSVAAIVVASRLTRGYVHTLERNLLNRGLQLESSEVNDLTTRNVMLRTMATLNVQLPQSSDADAIPRPPETHDSLATGAPIAADSVMRQMHDLRSRNVDRIHSLLQSEDAIASPLVAQVILLLAWDEVAPGAIETLRRVADVHTGQLVDALVDGEQDFSIRRRVARVLSGSRSQRAADGLMLGLRDQRFEVRYQCARSLASIVDANSHIKIDRDVIFEVVQRETAVSRPIWESNRLLAQLDDGEDQFVDEFVKTRASRSLAHVFTVLALALPPEPLRVAFRALHTEDPGLRGTALEYLESVLPPGIRERLWPFLEDGRPSTKGPARPRDQIVADLLRSHRSIVLNLEELQRRGIRSNS